MENLQDSSQELANEVLIAPTVFGYDFKKGNITWKRLQPIKYDNIGRLLVCHLLLENHLDMFIELSLPKGISIENAKLSFSQKVKMIGSDSFFTKFDFIQSIITINKIRNGLSHDIESLIDPEETKIISLALKRYADSAEKPFKTPDQTTHTNIAIIEFFTSICCAVLAGACTRMVDRR